MTTDDFIYLWNRIVVVAMTGEDEPVQYCTVNESINLRAALQESGIEYLDVDDDRTVVIYQRSILMVTAIDGHATAACEFEVALWEPPTNFEREPDALLTMFLEELLASTDTSPN